MNTRTTLIQKQLYISSEAFTFPVGIQRNFIHEQCTSTQRKSPLFVDSCSQVAIISIFESPDSCNFSIF